MNYYLAGPFFIKECSEFFDRFIQRCRETGMANYDTIHEDLGSINMNAISVNSILTKTRWDEKDNVENKILSLDKVFVPGHFKINFNKIKSEYDPVSFRRVLRQVLDLDLNNLTEGIVVYPQGYDLGTMFELGYFLGKYINGCPVQVYKDLRRSLIIHNPDSKLIECIEYFIGPAFYKDVMNKFNMTYDKLLISEGEPIMNMTSYNCVALNVDCYKSTPFNSILAGILYYNSIPFFTYSISGADSNVMMIASSLFHVKLDPDKDIQDQLRGEVMNSMHSYYWDNSYFDKFNDIK